ncbi:MarR family winged helix-turn-helix transcriptional regulator [Actinocrispum wychmicini]|uniref:DNA-binding MarR family transcriptional regulator n=1 Tax=Actinocrispum wychmicini TaxID=1213861 RepID=A0A4R2J1F1_9PSEU|nr:MarR family transcriptional regulator [Actinocrispum wychmicini]TCO50646.1 DNA-binding MarR family transcriptional regulator [Actinocrispum wychmicini]
MGTRAERNRTNPDLGVLAGRLLFAVQGELFTALAAKGFDDIHPRHGAVLAYLDPSGVRATELSRLSGQHKQVIGTLVDELERLGYVERHPDPDDRRAKLVCPTERGMDQLRAAEKIMAGIQERHARRLGRDTFVQFKAMLLDVTEHQRRAAGRL